MNCNIRLLIKCVGLIIAIAAGSVSCFSAPSIARVMNHDAVAIPLGKTAELATLESNLLADGGQTVFVNSDFEELVIPIAIEGETSGKERNVNATVQASSSDKELLKVSLDKNQVVFKDGKCVVQLTMKRVEVEPEEPTVEPENPTPEPENPTVEPEEPTLEPEEPKPEPEEPTLEPENPTPEPENPTVEPEETTQESEEPTVEPEEPAVEPEEPKPEPEETTQKPEEPTSEPEETISAPENNLVLEEQNEAAVRVLPQLTLGTASNEDEPETAVTEEQPDTETEEQPEKEKQPETEAEKEPEGEGQPQKEESKEAQTLSTEVKFLYGDTTYSATIVLIDDAESENHLGNLSFCQSQFDSTKQIIIIGDKQKHCVVGEFPAMTKYILDGQNYMLYNGGNIVVPSGKEVKVDFSKTGAEKELVLKDGSGKTYTMKYAEFPEISEADFSEVIDENGAIIKDSVRWGEIKPTIKVEHLVMVENTPVWKEDKTIVIEENEKNELMIEPEQAEPGTYRLIVLWNEKEVTLERLEKAFFVQYTSVDRGGKENDQ